MKSRKLWMNVVTAVELLPLLAAAPILVYAQDAATPVAPAPAPSAAPSAVPVNEGRGPGAELSLSDITKDKVIKGFDIEALHKDSEDESSPVIGAFLRGKMYANCVKEFTITNVLQDKSASVKDGVGFKIIDATGKGISCVKAHNDAPCNPSSEQNKCVSLSVHFENGAKMDLDKPSYPKDVKIGLISTDSDTDKKRFDNPNDGEIRFTSGNTIRKREQEAAERAKQARIDALNDSYTNCRSSLDELAKARKALQDLLNIAAISTDDYRDGMRELNDIKAQLVKKEKLAQLKKLKNRIGKVKDADDAKDLSGELDGFATDNPEYSKEVRKAQLELKDHVIADLETTPENIAAAKEILGNVKGMEDVTASEAKAYDVQMHGLDIAQQAMMFQPGNFDMMTFQSFPGVYNNLYNMAQKDVQSSCRNTKTNSRSDSCNLAMKNFSAVSALPQSANAAYAQAVRTQQQQQQQQMEWQQRMMNIGNQAANFGMNTGPGNMNMNMNMNSMNTGRMGPF